MSATNVIDDVSYPGSVTGRAVGIILGVAGVNFVIYLFNQNNLVTRWCCRWHCSLFISNRSRTHQDKPYPVPRDFWAWDHLDAHHLFTSGFSHPLLLLLLRLFNVAFFIFTVIWGPLGPKCCASRDASDWMTFFTNWTFVLFGLQATLGSLATLVYVWQRSTGRTPVQQPRALNLLDKSFLLCLVTCEAAAIALTTFYWAVLYESENKIYLDNPFRHGVNVVLMLADILLSRVPIVSYHVQGPILYGTVYLIFLWGHWARKNVWVYSALDWRKGSSPIFYAAMIALILIAFLFMFALACLREWLMRCCRCTRSRRVSDSGDKGLQPPVFSQV